MSFVANPYRSHTCGELNASHENQSIKLSGWVHRKRDHGNLIFIDLRDHYGITQCVVGPESAAFSVLESIRLESVVTINGLVAKRTPETVNDKMSTGHIEIMVNDAALLSKADPLPLPVNTDTDFAEETRLSYRFLDLRRPQLHKNIILRSQIIDYLRRAMQDRGFMEIQTPILTSSSPEGARDYLVPSRIHPGCFYALPQAPQQFKQLLMVAGFDKYFQIAPCFRDEDARADRSPGEFYQLDMEMSFATQEDVFAVIEPVVAGLFKTFGGDYQVSEAPFVRIPYKQAMLTYGSDKPDLRNPLTICDVTEIFKESEFTLFKDMITKKGAVVRALKAPSAAKEPRSFFDKLNTWAQDQGMKGLGYISLDDTGTAKGPIAKFCTPQNLTDLINVTGLKPEDSVFFICDVVKKTEKWAGALRDRVGHDLNLIEKDAFRFCWIVDFPLYEIDEKTGKLDFSHNPFSMPQGGLEALQTQDPLEIYAFQYDIVCNGVELCSGAIRNHLPEVMYKAFDIVGYSQADVDTQFQGMINAFKYGAPPHGGCAPGVDRMIMLLTHEPNIREVIAFPLNQQAQDLMMKAPSPVAAERLKELHLALKMPITVSPSPATVKTDSTVPQQ